MRRCLIAIFALHFFLSVSAFAFGNVQSAQQEHPHAVSVAATGADASSGLDTGKVESSARHALVDELPDLPDSLPRVAAVQRPPVDGGLTPGYRQRAALPPALDGLLRPPQQAALTA